MTKTLKRYFWLALLAHLLLFLSFSLALVFEPEQVFEKKSEKFLPAYLYQKESAALKPSQDTPQPPLPKQAPPPEPQLLSPDKVALKKQTVPRQQPPRTHQPQTLSSASFLEAESPKTGRPSDEPLLKELSRATAAKLYYPSEAAAYHLTGTATVSFLLYPDGRVAEVTLAKSSGFRILDEAALNTIKAISPVRDANMYVTKPRYLLAGIIFG